MAFSNSYQADLEAAAGRLGIPDAAWLKKLIQAESGWNPTAYNSSGATGLLQFMPRTMKDFGFVSNDVARQIPPTGTVPAAAKAAARADFLTRYPTVHTQLLGPVITYLKRYAPFPNEQALYLAVFYPDYQEASPDTAFPANVSKQNPGIETIADYIALVEGKAKTALSTPTGKLTAAIIGVSAVFGLYFLLRTSQKKGTPSR